MTFAKPQYAFSSGEFSPTLYARTDLEKYDLGAAKIYNFFVDYRGGVSSRPGNETVGEVPFPAKNSRIYTFDFGIDIANTYLLCFSDNIVRFVQDGGYVLEGTQTITGATQADPCVVTITGHPYSTGDMIFIADVAGMTELNGRLFNVGTTTVNTVELNEVYDAINIDSTAYTAYTSGGTAARVYTVATPYTADDLNALVAEQRRDTVMLTHPDYPTQKLVRNDVTDWVLSEFEIDSTVPVPTNLVATASATGDAEYGYAVTAVQNGKEGRPTRMYILTGAVNISSAAGQIVLTWDAATDVDYYNIYRTTIAPAANGMTAAEQLGFLGIAFAANFTDTNIVPDFTRNPPQEYNPFADGAVEYINITAGGTGYDQNTSTMSITGDGTDFEGYPIVDGAGVIVGAFIQDRGQDYTTATVSFAGSGSGATATATLGEIGGNNPRASKIFQQRQILGGTDNQPLGVFGSRPGEFENFDDSVIPSDGDSYEFELDAEQVSPIRYFIALQRGLIAFTGAGVWNVTGGNEIAITPLNVDAEAQTYIGSADVKPIAIDNDLLYVQKESGVVRVLAYNRLQDIYTGADRSILSNHFFSRGKTIKRWSWAQAPYYLVWATRTDGRFFSFTYLKEQDVYAWTQHETQGRALDVSTVEERGQNIPYFLIEREIAGVTRLFIERQARRDGLNAEDYNCVDASVTAGKVQQEGTIRVSAATGTVTISVTGAAPFSSANIGDHIRANGGLIEVTAFTDSSNVTGKVLIELIDRLPDASGVEGEGAPIPTDEWYMNPTFTRVEGLWHLEGMEVTGLQNGSPIPPVVVENGGIDVREGTSLAHVGLAYQCEIRPLPIVFPDAVIEGKVRAIANIDLRLNLTRGLSIAADEDSTTYIVQERSTEDYDEPNRLINGIVREEIPSEFETENPFILRVDAPLPTTVLGYTVNMDVGDDNDES